MLHKHQVHPTNTKFVATSAVREATNQQQFISTIHEETNCKIEILSGEEEARLIYNGVLQFLPVYTKTVLTIDIGGGSTEFVIGKNGVVNFAVSLKLGHVSLTENFAQEEMRKHIHSVIIDSGLVQKINGTGFDIAIGSSGTIRAIEKAVFSGYGQDLMTAVLSHGDFKRKWSFTRKELSDVVAKLCNCDGREDEVVMRNGVFKRRSEFILAGAVLLDVIFEVLGIREMEVSEYALGEGVIAEILAGCCEEYDVNANARWRSVVRVAKKFNSDKRMNSAARCVDIAREFIAGLRKYDERDDHPDKNVLALDAKDIEYLEAACLLHNIGIFIDKKGYHKQSYHIIKNGDYLHGYSVEEVELIALLARYHRKKFPKLDHSSLHVLPDKLKEKFRILCGLVRISVAVQQCLCMTFQGLQTSNYPEGIKLVFSLSKDQNLLGDTVQPTLEDVEAELKTELEHFEQVFRRKLSIALSLSS